MLIKPRTIFENCPSYEARSEIVAKIVETLQYSNYSANPDCKQTILEEVIDEVAKFIEENPEPENAVMMIEDPIRAVIARGILRLIGIHARVKLAEKTTREDLNNVRNLLQQLYDLSTID